ncbi:aldo-keto reductase YhdN [Lachnospiraceae bacterium]|jgi:Predicted oxidoreductases (related to aryl-alcohol dehydrogenases)|nr:aldo-keto reductase YhdN [Lachnospiraceae bacterium]GFI70525.1 aldo-keto reductase YhdN [Lachnospiraceae bacterium]
MADLCLGTAQLGMKYGINNVFGKPDRETVFEILDKAVNSGIHMIDTASIYGEAEEILGEYLSTHLDAADKIHIISKQCCSVDGMDNTRIEKTIRDELEQSLVRLDRSYLDGYLLHSYRETDKPETLAILKKIKEEGLVRKTGVSVYEIDEAEYAVENGDIDYLQMPCSVFDQRGLTSGVFQKARERGITVFTRSAFLQGLLMMEENKIPVYLQGIVPYIHEFNGMLQRYNLDKKHAVVKFVLSKQLVDYMVFGIETVGQLGEILAERDSSSLPEEFVRDVEKRFSCISEDLILPIHWKGK